MSRQRPCATGTRARSTPAVPLHSGVSEQPGIHNPGLPTSNLRLFLLSRGPSGLERRFFVVRSLGIVFWLGADLGDVLGPKTGVFRLGTSGSDVRRVPASRLAIHKLALVFKTFETFETFHVRHVAWLRGRRPVPDNLGLNLSTDLRFFRQNDVWWGGRRLGGWDGLILDQIYRVDCWIWARMSMD